MTVTENNRQEEFGATRTFTVREHAADRLKSQINRNNGQVLNRRRTVGGQGKGGTSVSAVSRNAAPERSAGGIRPASPDAVSEIRPVRAAEKTVPERSVIREIPSEVTRPIPERTLSDASAARISRLADAAAKAEEREAQDNAILDAKKKPSSVQNKAALASMQMMKTRTSDLGIEGVRRTPEKPAKKEEKAPKEKVVSDAGGNTVVSVVKAIVYIIFVVIISVVAAIAIILVSNDVFAFVKSDEVVEITLPEYTTLDELATILYRNDVIKYPKVFKYYAVYKKDDQKYIAGDYTVSPMMNYKTLLAEFKEKEVTGTVRVTIPEGFSTDDIISLFVDQYGIGTREGFVDAIQNHDFDYWFLRELEEHGVKEGRIYRLDGYLFPDTYEFYLNSSEVTVLNKMLRRFAQIFTREYRNLCAELGFTVDEIVTLASMIEKEAAEPSEFLQVSSVFHNRLKIPDVFPRMESDATVVYAIAHDTGERTVDLYYDTPYNTYQHDGLPPGPIANPSASALLAALTVQETPYYYFVSGMGTTFFSETKEEHDQHIAEIREAAQASGGELTNIPQIYVEPEPKPVENPEGGEGTDEPDPWSEEWTGDSSGETGDGTGTGTGTGTTGTSPNWWENIDWSNPIFWGVDWDHPDTWSPEVRAALGNP
ncbi:MAG: endolytic transglycosylase MltG [Clostridia bacterium]|nr:endolytic transglycosylase MltG [Clostridia bacterium]